MNTAAKIRLFRKELKTRHPQVNVIPDDNEILAFIDSASRVFRNYAEEKQVRMAVSLAADHYMSKQRLNI